MKIEFNFDELPAEPGDVCYNCNEPITGKKFVPFLQMGSPEEVAHFHKALCEECYYGILPEEKESPRTV